MLPARTPAVPGAVLDHRQAAFLNLLPVIQSVARRHFRHVRCPDTKLDRVAEATALAWLCYLRLVRKGRDPAQFVVTFSQLVARAVNSGRRVCGQEKAKDALSPVCQRRRNWTWSGTGVRVLSISASSKTLPTIAELSGSGATTKFRRR